MDLNNLFSQVWPLYTQTNFWITLLITVLVWYVVALGLTHLLFGAGGRSAVGSARLGMGFSVVLIAAALAGGVWFLFRPADLIYTVAICVTFLLVSLLMFAVFSKLGAEN